VPDVRSAVLSTGVTPPYAEQGNVAGVPVLLLHGYADSRRSFDLLLPTCRRRCTPTCRTSAATATPAAPPAATRPRTSRPTRRPSWTPSGSRRRSSPARVWKAAFRGLLDAEVPIESGTIAAPTLIVWGERDDLCPRSGQEALAAAIAGAELVTYPGTGHAVGCELPARTAADIAAFALRLS
jgi:pimeloyl-ACP methyl ester carboxylesterase